MPGDTLARGGRSAIFGPPRGITQKRWDKIWEKETDAGSKRDVVRPERVGTTGAGPKQ